MAKTTRTETAPATFNLNESSATLAKVGDTQYQVTGKGDVTVYAEAVRVSINGRRAAPEGRVDVETNNGTLVVTSSGVIRPSRGAPPAAPLPIAKEEQKPEVVKVKVKFSEYFPKLTPQIGEDTGDGWTCVSKQTLLGKFIHGESAPVKVAKYIGDGSYAALENTLKTEKAKGISNLHIPDETELRGAFNTVAEVISGFEGTPGAIWVRETTEGPSRGTTAVGLTEQDKGKSLRIPKATGENAVVLFGTFKP